MSETKHTPGPWTTEPHGNTVALYSGRDGWHHGLRLMNLDDGDANFAANARLIAAAPEMYEALRLSLCLVGAHAGAVDPMRDADERRRFDGEIERIEGLIRDAIAKAERREA